MIPDDIRKAAEAVIDRGYDEGMVEALERALMAERERAAKVVENYDKPFRTRGDIAAAIRSGDNPDA
jgi:hypothetical protein